MRVTFLYVGQGEATFVLMPDGRGRHLSMLIDCNRCASLKGIDLSKFLCDVLPKNNESRPVLDVFVNTHPHSDHLGGLDEIRKAIDIGAVWHSGHKPSSAHEGPYGDLAALINSVRARGGEEIRIEGSRLPTIWGAGEVHILSPAAYIVDDVEDETPEHRDARIHDQCGVLRLAYGGNVAKTRVMITGDSDKEAWKRITGYHGRPEDNRVQAHVLSASHHGSYTFFKDWADDPEPYEDHLKAIAPERVIISAPDQKHSKHGHPDDDAVRRYESAVGKDFIHHMGSRGWSFFVDAFEDGTYALGDDRGELARTFCFDENKDGSDGEGGGAKKAAPAIISRVERSRPMGER
jgi:beta-lactamase superfamily II metal-dependent hydrolase